MRGRDLTKAAELEGEPGSNPGPLGPPCHLVPTASHTQQPPFFLPFKVQQAKPGTQRLGQLGGPGKPLEGPGP